MNQAINQLVLDWVLSKCLIAPGNHLLLALSGGADSTCLARILLNLRSKLHLNLTAAHFNHQLRGAESDRDQSFVEAFCQQFNLPLIVGTKNVAEEAKGAGLSLEEAARNCRYAFFRDAAKEAGANRIATAHNLDDNLETVLLHLIRGAGIRGLAGIPPKRGEIIRPLLCVRRTDILAHLETLSQAFVEDSTNQHDIHRRNALRQNVLPLLKVQNPNLAQTVLRQSEALREDSCFLDSLAEKTFAQIQIKENAKEIRLSAAKLAALDRAIASRVATLAVKAAGATADWTHINQILHLAAGSHPSAKTNVRGNVLVQREYDALVFLPHVGNPPSFNPVILPAEGSISIPEAGFFITSTENPSKNPETFHTFLFKRAGICGKITVRPRKEGDRISLAGRNGTKTVKKLMIERKVPERQRQITPVFSDESGVLAVYGLGIDRRVAPSPGDAVRTIIVGGITSCTKT